YGLCTVNGADSFIDTMKNLVGSSFRLIYERAGNNKSAHCSVNSAKLLKNYTGSIGSYARGQQFKALAIGYLKSEDIWSINESEIVVHEKDGTH
ncbi:MAG: hypothetical protein OXC37_06010, partial [Bdellovibrionaceae bacterium]|nr:hypothetical protein [Pseudobdellovibrionaceae bacterium]